MTVKQNDLKKKTRYSALPRSFYEPSADVVAPQLLGHWLVRRFPYGVCAGTIVETEAYLTNDPACHAFPGPTPRNRTMFGQAGHGYIYFIYGCHFCVNAVCRPAGIGEAVLIRAIEPLVGEEIFRKHRLSVPTLNWTNGPGKIAQAMQIDRQLDGVDLCNPTSPLIIARNAQRDAFCEKGGPILTSPRIGITRAAMAPLRFFLAGNPYVSRRKKI
jgi:DNA-3-methyladenine glycosylase